MNLRSVSLLGSVIVVLGVTSVAISQPAASPPIAGAPYVAGAAADPATDAEREKIWNSPTMLRARAWVQEYCARSAKITPAEAQQYMTELEHLSPVQMKLWLLKFDHEEATIRQQQSDFNRSRGADVSQGRAVEAATDQAYANVNRDENEAAQSAEQSLTTEQQEANARNLQDDQARDASNTALGPLYGGYGGYPYGGYNPLGAIGDGGMHIHVHVHPR